MPAVISSSRQGTLLSFGCSHSRSGSSPCRTTHTKRGPSTALSGRAALLALAILLCFGCSSAADPSTQADETRYFWIEYAALEESTATWIGVRDGELSALRFSVANSTVSDVRDGANTPAVVERLFGLLRERGIETFDSEYVGDPETSIEDDRLRLVANTERGHYSVFAFATLAPQALHALVDEVMSMARAWRAVPGAPRFLRCAEIPRSRADAMRAAGRPSIRFEDRRSIRLAPIAKAVQRPGWFVPIPPDQLDHKILAARRQLVMQVGNQTFLVSIYGREE